jgi:arylsulfatase A-like enzyme
VQIRSKSKVNNPNFLVVVWDACRLDKAVENADFLSSIADENIWFENAVAPSRWSLPSHTSLLSEEYPSTHRCCTPYSHVESLPLLDRLHDDGYTSYGVSANTFFSSNYGFAQHFDEFHHTVSQKGFEDGIDLNDTVYNFEQKYPDSNRLSKYKYVVNQALRHEKKIKSLVNLGIAAGSLHFPFMSSIETTHEFFRPPLFSYDPSRNTEKILEIIEQESVNENPFFIITNYMDTHSPYWPSRDLQKEFLDDVVGYTEIDKLNHRAMLPFEYIENIQQNELPNNEIETVRNLYDVSVKEADRHLQQIIKRLERQDLKKNTIVVITADHGENLGEEDEFGRKRMGHVDSVSDDLLKVPLVVANPSLESKTIDSYVNIKDIGNLLRSSMDNGNIDADRITKDQVIIECPASKQDDLFDRYDDVPEEAINRQVSQHTVVGYQNDWKVVADSEDRWYGFKDGEKKQPDEIPTDLRERCASHLSKLEESVPLNQKITNNQIDKSTREELEDLGYLV